jgi:signal transduction histidine kinase
VFLSRRLTASGRVALAVTTVLVIGVVALALVAYFGVSRRLAGDTDRSLVREAEAYAAAIAPETQARHEEDLVAVSRAYLAARTGVETESHPVLLVRFASGKVLSNSSLPLESFPGQDKLLDVRSASRRFDTVVSDRGEYRVATVPVLDGNAKTVAVFEAALSAAPTRQVATQLGWTLFAAGMAIVLLGAALSALFAQASLRPLREAADTAGSITFSSLGSRVAYRGPNDEVGRLVSAFNAMLDRLEMAVTEQRRFVADASHELRTPLAVVRGHLELLAQTETTAEERDETFALVFDELDRTSRLVDDMLRLAKLETGPTRPYQPVELSTLVTEAVGRCSALCCSHVVAHCSSGSTWVLGDPDELMQVMLNLLRNAEAHTPHDGRITVSCTAEGGKGVVEVADTGTGIKPADLPRIFDRFYRASGPRSKQSGGSGLGLAITKRLVEMHGGRISARNGGGGGAVFRVELPAIETPADLFSDTPFPEPVGVATTVDNRSRKQA